MTWCCTLKICVKGEVTSVEEGHDVERVTALRVKFGVRSVIAKETFSATVKLAREIDEIVSRDKLWRAKLSCLSRPACEDWLHGEVSFGGAESTEERVLALMSLVTSCGEQCSLCLLRTAVYEGWLHAEVDALDPHEQGW